MWGCCTWGVRPQVLLPLSRSLRVLTLPCAWLRAGLRPRVSSEDSCCFSPSFLFGWALLTTPHPPAGPPSTVCVGGRREQPCGGGVGRAWQREAGGSGQAGLEKAKPVKVLRAKYPRQSCLEMLVSTRLLQKVWLGPGILASSKALQVVCSLAGN